VAGEGAEAVTRLQRLLSLSWLSVGDNKFPVIGPNDIVPGHEKPTMILARMLAAEMLQHLDVEQSPPTTTGSKTRKASLSFPSFVWEIHERYRQDSNRTYLCESWLFEYRVFIVNGAVVKFSDEEVKILSDARTQRDALVARKKTADAEAARQQAAIDAIAKICKIPESHSVTPETLAVSDGRSCPRSCGSKTCEGNCELE
jgi:hypothetical protein